MATRTIEIVAPEGTGITTKTITDAMNERFQEIKKANPRGFMDQFEEQMDVICMDIAQANNGQYDRQEVNGKEELLFVYGGVSIEQARKIAAGV